MVNLETNDGVNNKNSLDDERNRHSSENRRRGWWRTGRWEADGRFGGGSFTEPQAEQGGASWGAGDWKAWPPAPSPLPLLVRPRPFDWCVALRRESATTPTSETGLLQGRVFF